jgi:proteasome lid subunit RPN8/RPN11
MYKDLIEEMHKHSVEEYPKEACGIITKQFEYIRATNISSNPKSSFIINPLDIIRYEDNIWGFFHSHPGSSDPIPSKRDMPSALFNEYKFLVGFASKVYIYWVENNILKFEQFNEHHCSLL